MQESHFHRFVKEETLWKKTIGSMSCSCVERLCAQPIGFGKFFFAKITVLHRQRKECEKNGKHLSVLDAYRTVRPIPLNTNILAHKEIGRTIVKPSRLKYWNCPFRHIPYQNIYKEGYLLKKFSLFLYYKIWKIRIENARTRITTIL